MLSSGHEQVRICLAKISRVPLNFPWEKLKSASSPFFHLVSRLRTPSSKRHRIRIGETEPFWESTPLLNTILKGKKKSNGNFQSILGWPLGGSGFWVMSTKVTTVVKGTSVSCWESCRKKFVCDRLVLGTHSNSPPIWLLLLLPWIKTQNTLL